MALWVCRTRQQDVLNVQGALYAVTLFLGIYNSITVQPAIAIERAVFYRERSAYMYAVGPWCIAQVSQQGLRLLP